MNDATDGIGQIELTVAIITFAGVLLNAIALLIINFFQSRNSKKSRKTTTIISERVRWGETLRIKFVSFNNSVRILNSSSGDINKVLSDYDEISMLINITEKYSKELYNEMNNLINRLRVNNMRKEAKERYLDNITRIQRIILKSEWRRIKIETDKGVFLNPVAVEKIYLEVAHEIDDVPKMSDIAKDLFITKNINEEMNNILDKINKYEKNRKNKDNT